jgi:hypothetical protein
MNGYNVTALKCRTEAVCKFLPCKKKLRDILLNCSTRSILATFAWLRMSDQSFVQFVVLFTAQKLKKSKTWQDG